MLFFILMSRPQISNNISNIKRFQEFMKLLLLTKNKKKARHFSVVRNTVTDNSGPPFPFSTWLRFSAYTTGCLKKLC